MKKERQYENERLQCLKLKAEIVSLMTQNVKLMIAIRGFTPTEIATAYIVKTFNYHIHDYAVTDPHIINLKDNYSLPSYRALVYNDSRTKIIDIIF